MRKEIICDDFIDDFFWFHSGFYGSNLNGGIV